MEPSGSTCLLPSFLSWAVNVLLHFQLNSVASFPFLAWSRISYHQAFTLIRSKQKLKQIGISYSFSPTSRDLFFLFLETENSKRDNCKMWTCLKGSICSSKLFAFSKISKGRSLWWKAKSVLALWSPRGHVLSQDMISLRKADSGLLATTD